MDIGVEYDDSLDGSVYEVAGALDGAPLWWLVMMIAAVIATTITAAAAPRMAHSPAFDEAGWVGGGADTATGGREYTAGGGGGGGGAEGPIGGRECRIGVGGGGGGALTGVEAGVAVFFWCWACSMALPNT